MDRTPAPNPFGQGHYASSSRPAFCFTCGRIADADQCFPSQHDIGLNMLDSTESGPFHDSSHSWNSHLSVFTSPESSWNTGYLDGSSDTHGSLGLVPATADITDWSWNSDFDMYIQATDSHLSSAAPDNSHLHGSITLPAEQRSAHGPSGRPLGPSSNDTVQLLNAASEMLLTPLLQRCLAEQRFPLPREIQGLALCEGIEERVVEAWLFARLAQHRPPPTERIPSINFTSPESESNEVNITRSSQDIVRVVQELARRRFSHECFSAHSRKSAESGGPYECTSGCGYSTDERDSWQRHEQLWQPQEFWYCILCRGLSQKPVIRSRKNKIFEHFGKCHRDVPKEDYHRLRDQSKVHHEPGYERTCKFWSSNGVCEYRFKSWTDRIEHYLQHFTNKVRDGPWRLRYTRRRWFDDDEDPGKDTSPTGTNTSTTSKSADNSQSTTGSSSSSGGYRNQAANRCDLTLRIGICDVSSPFGIENPLEKDGAILPKKLINVATLSWSCATPRSKYVALDSSPSGTISWPTRAITFFGGLDEYEAQLSELSHTCAPFREACSIVSNMGYDHLWIDALCESRDDMEHMQALYERAVLTIVLVSSPQNANRISHFSCHYSNIKQVRSWAVESCSVFHVKILGHGAFGIVDEVRLGAAPDLYARKMLLGPKAHRLLKATQFREIEIMQKLRHENIAEFVAAYVDHRSLNILMRPVAEYSLKDFLAEPSLWPGKLQHIPRWLCSLASAVSYMHGLLLRHKDIKPANILVRGSDVFLSDFGTAFDFSASHSGTNGAGPMTPKYCAPEVARKAYRGRKADVFSLGCVYLELATVGTGFSLDQLDECLGFGGDGAKSNNVYCKHLGGVSRWMRMLLERPVPGFFRKAIELCMKMMSRNHVTRPSAFEIHHVLLSAAVEMPPNCPLKSIGFVHSRNMHAAPLRLWGSRRAADEPLWKIGRATSAAPTYPSPMQIGDGVFRDGATGGANNPVKQAHQEGRQMQMEERNPLPFAHCSLRAFSLQKPPRAALSTPKVTILIARSLGGIVIKGSVRMIQKSASATGEPSTQAGALISNSRNRLLPLLMSGTDDLNAPKDSGHSSDGLPPGAEQFEYRPSCPGQIRLLRLHPGEKDDAVRCTMITHDRLDTTHYVALSYIGGNQQPTRRIILSDDRKDTGKQSVVHIRPNLHNALKAMRMYEKSRLLWVDAICINQFDCAERCEQVSGMAEIYRQADKVFVWLGTSSPLTVADKHGTIDDSFNGERHNQPDGVVKKHRTPREMSESSRSQRYRRHWVIQEVVAAKQIAFISEQHHMEASIMITIAKSAALDTKSEAKHLAHATAALHDETSEEARDRTYAVLLGLLAFNASVSGVS